MRVIQVIVLSCVPLLFLSGCRVWQGITPWRTASETRPEYAYEPLPPEQPVARGTVPKASSSDTPGQPDLPVTAAPKVEQEPSDGTPPPSADPAPIEATASMDPPPVETVESAAGELEAPVWPPPFEARFKGEKPKRLGMPVPVFPEDFDWSTVPGGWVDVRVTIGPEGHVVAVEPVEASDPDLVEPTLTALRKARYEPARAPNSVPIQVDFVERVEY